jgi:hypothetical protein
MKYLGLISIPRYYSLSLNSERFSAESFWPATISMLLVDSANNEGTEACESLHVFAPEEI